MNEGYRPIPRGKQQMGGGLFFLAGSAMTAWSWYTALCEGYYYRNAVLIFPAFAVIGLGLILFPGYKEERLARGEDITNLSGLQLLTPRWRVILGLAIAASLGNWAAMGRL